MGGIGREIGHFLVGVMFLTRLPVPVRLDHADGRLARAARYFPLVGLLIGAVVGGVFWCAALVLPGMIAAGIALAVGLLLTGALHEDGFADCCDGLGGGSTRERVLEIMRDSRLGTYGAAGLVFSIGLRWSALSALSPGQGFGALIVGHAVSRAMIPPVLASGRYARSEGLASHVAGVGAVEVAVALALGLLVAMIVGPAAGLVAVCASAVGAALMFGLLLRRLGGYTGDGLGAVQQVAEIAILLTFAGLWS
jgi:adenosylcobinamide-GDP ribazoletransferase